MTLIGELGSSCPVGISISGSSLATAVLCSTAARARSQAASNGPALRLVSFGSVRSFAIGRRSRIAATVAAIGQARAPVTWDTNSSQDTALRVQPPLCWPGGARSAPLPGGQPGPLSAPFPDLSTADSRRMSAYREALWLTDGHREARQDSGRRLPASVGSAESPGSPGERQQAAPPSLAASTARADHTECHTPGGR